MDTTLSTQSNTPSLDPQAVQLAQAIRQTESGGNFEAKGASGEYGAYQFEPATWDLESPSVLGANVPLQSSTPEQQNQVAYTKIKQLKDSGENVAQIASTWNAGDPNAYAQNHVGTNSSGVAYNTPAYAENVAKTYQEIKSGQPMTSGAVNQTINGVEPKTDSSIPGMPTWEKLMFGIPLVAGGIGLAIATGGASVPEEAAAGADALGATGILRKGANFIKGLASKPLSTIGSAFGIEGTIDEGKNILGIGDNSQAQADETANASEQAGQTEENATQNASRANTEEQESIADEQRTQDQIKSAQNAQDALNQSLKQTPTGKVLSQNSAVQDAMKTMAQYGLMPDTSQGYDNYSQAQQKSNALKSELSEGVEQILNEEGKDASLSDVAKKAYENIEKYTPTHEQASAKAHVDKVLQSYNENYGNGTGTISLGDMERGKREQGQAAGKWDSTKTSAQQHAYKAMNRGFRDTITDKTEHKDLYNRAMKEEQNLYNADKVMKHRNGKKSLEHKGVFRGILKSYGKYVGTYIGDRMGGPIGAVVGNLIGDKVVNAVDKRYGKTFFESKEGRKAIELASNKSPEISKVIEKTLKRYGVKKQEVERVKKMEKEQKIKSDITKSHQEWQKEKMDKSKEVKRQQYKEKKKGVLGETIQEKKSEYEPYADKLPIIKTGVIPSKKKTNEPVAEGSPKVYLPEIKQKKEKMKKSLYSPYIPHDKLPIIKA